MFSSKLRPTRPLPGIPLSRREVPIFVRLRNGWTATGMLVMEDEDDVQAFLNDLKRSAITLTGVEVTHEQRTERVAELEIAKSEVVFAHAP